MRLGTKARYAVMALSEISLQPHDKAVSLSMIAEQQQISLTYLEQLFLKLRKAGIIESVRGMNGGYMLAKPSEDIKILDIVNAVDTPLKATRCRSDSHEGCRDDGQMCLTHDLWDELSAVVRIFLGRVTLEDVKERRVTGMGRFGLFMEPKIMGQQTKMSGEL